MTVGCARRLAAIVMAAAITGAGAGAAAAQGAATQGPHASPQAPVQRTIQDQDQNQGQPIQIVSNSLEVRDKAKIATFVGNVQVVQGDTTMTCQRLLVFYGQEIGFAGADTRGTTPPPKPAPGASQGQQNIRRIEAHGNVTVVTKDQNASGDIGVYDLKTKTITLSGNVVVSQGPNVMHGERVVVDMVTGNARVESDTAATQNRVRALIQPGKSQNGGSTNFMTIGPGRTN